MEWRRKPADPPSRDCPHCRLRSQNSRAARANDWARFPAWEFCADGTGSADGCCALTKPGSIQRSIRRFFDHDGAANHARKRNSTRRAGQARYGHLAQAGDCGFTRDTAGGRRIRGGGAGGGEQAMDGRPTIILVRPETRKWVQRGSQRWRKRRSRSHGSQNWAIERESAR